MALPRDGTEESSPVGGTRPTIGISFCEWIPLGHVVEHADTTKQWAVDLYTSGLSVREVSRKLVSERGVHVSPQTVARWMRECGRSRPIGEHRSVEIDRNAKRLYESGSTLDQVARCYGVGRTTVAKRLRETGVAIRPSGSHFLHVLTRERLRELYLRKGNSVQQIADRCGCSVGTVYRLLRQYDFRRKDSY